MKSPEPSAGASGQAAEKNLLSIRSFRCFASQKREMYSIFHTVSFIVQETA